MMMMMTIMMMMMTTAAIMPHFPISSFENQTLHNLMLDDVSVFLHTGRGRAENDNVGDIEDYRSRQPTEPALWDFLSNKFPTVKGLLVCFKLIYRL